MGPIYLDWAATAPIDAAAIEAMRAAAAAWANPSSVHRAGRRARGTVDDARERIAAHLGCTVEQLVFTSGGTEAIGLALAQGTLLAQAPVRLVSAIEHDAVRAQAVGATIVPVGADGVIDLAALDRLLPRHPREGGDPYARTSGVMGPRLRGDDGKGSGDDERNDTPLVALMHVNNETGVIQPIAEVSARVRAAGGRLLVDAVQSAGKLALPDADYVAVSAHKLGGPPGVGALIVRDGDGFASVQRGGGQERGFRAGTENLPGIVGFAAALDARAADGDWLARAEHLRDDMEARLVGAEIVGGAAPRIGTIGCIRLPGVAATTQLMALDLAGFAVSAGAACSSGTVKPSHVLTAMGLSAAAAGEAIRVSIGWRTTAAEIDAFVAAWTAMAVRLGRRAA